MAAPKLPVTDRFLSRGVTKVWFVPVIAAATLIPTRAEIDAGTDLSDEVADWAGWNTSSAPLATPDLGTRFDRQIPGTITAEASSITFWADRSGDDARQVMPRDTQGFIVIADGGDVVGSVMDVFAVSVASVGKLRSISNGHQVQISYTITRVPVEDVPLPATA